MQDGNKIYIMYVFELDTSAVRSWLQIAKACCTKTLREGDRKRRENKRNKKQKGRAPEDAWGMNSRGAFIQDGKLRPVVENLTCADGNMPTLLAEAPRQRLVQCPGAAARWARAYTNNAYHGSPCYCCPHKSLEAQSASPSVPFSSLSTQLVTGFNHILSSAERCALLHQDLLSL